MFNGIPFTSLCIYGFSEQYGNIQDRHLEMEKEPMKWSVWQRHEQWTRIHTVSFENHKSCGVTKFGVLQVETRIKLSRDLEKKYEEYTGCLKSFFTLGIHIYKERIQPI